MLTYQTINPLFNKNFLDTLLNIPLGKNDIHIWSVDLDTQAIKMEPLWLLLSSQEKSRAGKFHFKQDQRRYIAAHGTLRQLLGNYLGKESAGLKFQYGKNGKPRLADWQNDMGLDFNLSHSHGVGLCGFSIRRPIGVDIEKMVQLPEMDQIARSFFSAKEWATFCQLPKANQLGGFYKCWTVKEAFVKAMGCGLQYPLDSFEVSVEPQKPGRLFEVNGGAKEAFEWLVGVWMPFKDMVAAVVVKGRELRLHHAQWEFRSTAK